MKKWLMAVLLGTVLVLGACGGSDDATEDTGVDETTETETEEAGDDAGEGGTYDVALAEEVYQQSCASCHGEDLSGGVGPDLNAVGSSYSAEEIVDIINNGLGSMPSVSLDEDEADAVAQWLADKK